LFSTDDVALKRRVAVVSDSLARTVFGTSPAIGKFIGDSPPAQIVGVVGDVLNDRLDESPRPAYYIPRTEAVSSVAYVLIRVQGDQHSWTDTIRSAVFSVDPSQPVGRIVTAERMVADSFRDRTFAAAAVSVASTISLMLAIAGLVGVTSWDLQQRRTEMGIRIAVGASRRAIIQAAMFPVLRPVATAVLVSWPVTLMVVGPLVRGTALDINASSSWIYLIAGSIMVGASAIACYLSALIASDIEPALIMGE